MSEKTEVRTLEFVAFLGGVALICVGFAMSEGVLRYSSDFPRLDLEGIAWIWHIVVITFLGTAGGAILVALWNLIGERERDRGQIKYLQNHLQGLLSGRLVGINPETGHLVCMRPAVRHDANNAEESHERGSPGMSLETGEVNSLSAVSGKPRGFAIMSLTYNQKLVLSIAAVASFAIWLFPHWLCHVRHPAPGVWNIRRDAGYSFLFLPPQAEAERVQKIAHDQNISVEITTVVDWTRQWQEWGTLAFLTALAFGGLGLWSSPRELKRLEGKSPTCAHSDP